VSSWLTSRASSPGRQKIPSMLESREKWSTFLTKLLIAARNSPVLNNHSNQLQSKLFKCIVAASLKSYDSELKTFRTQFLWVQNHNEFTALLAQHNRSMQEDETGIREGKIFYAFKQF
jgi:hypothetical protein